MKGVSQSQGKHRNTHINTENNAVAIFSSDSLSCTLHAILFAYNHYVCIALSWLRNPLININSVRPTGRPGWAAQQLAMCVYKSFFIPFFFAEVVVPPELCSPYSWQQAAAIPSERYGKYAHLSLSDCRRPLAGSAWWKKV